MKQIRHELGNMELLYLIDHNGHISMLLFPAGMKPDPVYGAENETVCPVATAEHNPDLRRGSLVHLHLAHHSMPKGAGMTYKFCESEDMLLYVSQDVAKDDGTVLIKTELEASGEYGVTHNILWHEGDDAIICWCEFKNGCPNALTLDMFSSFALDGLSPFSCDDMTSRMYLHRFLGGWSLEGRHEVCGIESLGLQKAWTGAFPCNERFGSVGSYPVDKYFGTALVEDREAGVIWGAQIEHNASWQMELTRMGDNLSFSGGLADADFGLWQKIVGPGECFASPRVYLTAVKNDWETAAQALLSVQKHACKIYGEDGLGIVYNEYCSSWGDPRQDKIMEYADALSGHGIKYLVIDAGWSEGSKEQLGNGTWKVDKERFPDIKAMNESLREKGYVPGIWCEFEVTTEGSELFLPEHDDEHLKRNGHVIKNDKWRSYWDFRKPEVRAAVLERLVRLLRDNGFGYLKVDYNANTGAGIDALSGPDGGFGNDGPGENLRDHLAHVRQFFEDLKREIPGLVIENCASGGHRLEPSMIGVTAMTSFSDAHEAREIPVIAANEQFLILPRQNQIWIVLHREDDRDRICYSLAAGFLGRMCLSGDVTDLAPWQWELVDDAVSFYGRAEDVIINGITHIYGDRSERIRHPQGTQVVARRSGRSMLIVCHAFEKRDEGESDVVAVIHAGGPAVISAQFNNDGYVSVTGGDVVVHAMPEWSACAVLAEF